MNARRNRALARLRACHRDACWACAGGHRLVAAYSIDRLRVGASKLRGGWLCGRAHQIDRARAGTEFLGPRRRLAAESGSEEQAANAAELERAGTIWSIVFCLRTSLPPVLRATECFPFCSGAWVSVSSGIAAGK